MVRDALIQTLHTDKDVVRVLATMEQDFKHLFETWIDNSESRAAAKIGLLLTERWVACEMLRFMLAANELVDRLSEDLVQDIGQEIEYLRETAMGTGDWSWAEREVQEIITAIFDDDDDLF